VFNLEQSGPLITFAFRGSVSAADFDEYLAAYDAILARDKQWVSIFDARDVRPLDSKQVRRQADWIKRNAAVLSRLNLGIAFVIPSPMIRGVLRAILWIQPLPQPHVVVANMSAAYSWCAIQLRAVGLPVPSIPMSDDTSR
jgi:hypothetical protein